MMGIPHNWPRAERVAPESPDYPPAALETFGAKAPALTLLGNRDLLNRRGIGFCGSRKASEKGMAAARDCAEQAVRRGFVVISGNAAGIDFAAHHAALAAGGTTILVLPEGIDHFRVRKGLAPEWDWERVLVISPFAPTAVWRASRAMMRNKLIIALSRAMIVVEAGEKGGTMHAGLNALKSRKPLFVINYHNVEELAPGNARLLKEGALPLMKNRATGRAAFDRVVKSTDDAFMKERCDEQFALL